MSRLRRIAYYAILNMQKSDLPKHPQYARVLGFNQIGQEILSQLKKATNILVTPNFKSIAKKSGFIIFTNFRRKKWLI